MKGTLQVESEIVRTPRVMQVEGMFDVPVNKRSQIVWDVELPLSQKEWQIGLVCGPSGSGKTTIARRFFGDVINDGFDWPEERSILDGFSADLSIKTIVQHLSSVGFNSPPAWLRPFHVLSNGEQFRVTMARILAEAGELTCVDEFTSVVDRTAARIGSAALSKAIRRGKKKFVAVTCHTDVAEWLQPDWIYLPAENSFQWRSLQRRPAIEIVVNRAPQSAWHRFKHHHYLNQDLSRAAVCFLGFYKGEPIVFDSWINFFGATKGKRQAKRGHRTVVLPDYQGVGIGRGIVNHCASLWSGMGEIVFSGVGHPAEVASRMRDPNWRCTKAPGLSHHDSKKGYRGFAKTRASTRLRASFVYRGEPMPREQAMAQLAAWVK